MGMPDGQSLAPRLSSKPEAKSFSVEDLLRDVARGRVRIPSFQRGLKWVDADRVALLDSLYRGFPIGTLLLWKKRAAASEGRLPGLELELTAREDALWVVDGQQRLMTLVTVLLAPKEAVSGRAMRFDLDGHRFGYGPEKALPPPRWIPVSEVLDSSRLLRWAVQQHLGGSGDAEDRARFDAMLELGKRVREYSIPAYVVETDDDQVLRQIFERTNQTGRRMTPDEVFDALVMPQPGQPEEPSTSIRAIERSPRLLDLGFGSIPRNLIFQALIAIESRDPFKGADQFRTSSLEEMKAALPRVEDALVRVLGFLREFAEVPHFAFLPYGYPVSGLCRFFDLFPDPVPRSRMLLSRWLWRGAMSREHAWGSTALKRMMEAVRPGDEEGSVQRLLATVAAPAEHSPRLSSFDRKKAQSRMELAALATLQPRDLRPAGLFDEKAAGEVLSFEKFCDQQDGPAVRLLSSNHLDLPHARTVASRVLHPEGNPSELRAWVAECSEEAVLRSHGISTAAQEALREGRLGAFLAIRNEMLEVHVRGFLARKAAWNPPDRDRPSHTYLAVPDE